MKTLLLIDANSLIHRSFHALPPLTTPDKKPIQAIYGLAGIFLRLWREEKPEYAAALFDRPEPTFRKKKYEAYKAQRPPAPDELVSQIIEAHNFFSEFGVKTFEKPGFEADDLIATLAERFKNEPGVRVVILTGDMDTLQLVHGDKVVVRTFKKGISETFTYDDNAVMERYGLVPAQITDYKALVGDPSDNIKGVPGIGPKTASALLKKYATLENIYEHLHDDPKLEKKLVGTDTQVKLSKELVVLERHVPIEAVHLETLKPSMDEKALRSYFRELGFESLVRRMGAQPRHEITAGLQQAMWSDPERGKIPDQKPPKKGIGKILLVRGAPKKTHGYDGFESKKIKVGFDLKRTLKQLWKEGEDLLPPYCDLGVAFWLLRPDMKDYSPEAVSREFLGRPWSGNDEDFYRAWEFAMNELKAQEIAHVFHDIEMPVLRILAEMESVGVRVNPEKLLRLERNIGSRLKELSQNVFREAGEEFNLNSPKQLSRILFEKLPSRGGRPIRKTPGGQFSTSAQNLAELRQEYPIVKHVLKYRDGAKILTTYVKPFLSRADSRRRLHTEFIQTGTATGRISSHEPNLQNIPRDSEWANELRGAIEAPHGHSLLAFDYSQIELRILASLSGDPKMIRAFEDNLDIHRMTAATIFDVPLENVQPEMRRVAKILNFGLVYGMGIASFARVSGLGRNRAGQFIRTYFSEFSGIREWQERAKRDARTLGFAKTLTGRRRPLPGILSELPRTAAEAERAAVNHPIQGLNADILKLAMIRAKSALQEKGWWGREAKLILSIHDELLFEVSDSMINETIEIVRNAMEGAFALGVRLVVHVSRGMDWGKVEKITP
ncbi:MAG: hypothetical protein HY435_00895 [Candidatus Liptonbacteria bacterium]|nr:hypothetical protein [Candidatus Liptonbacteria bacterium]